MASCENCIHAQVTTGRNVIVKNGVTIIQQASPGGYNITCKAGTIREMSFIDDEMRCSSFRERGEGGAADTAGSTGTDSGGGGGNT